jgi:hypothetical protein
VDEEEGEEMAIADESLRESDGRKGGLVFVDVGEL